MFLNVIFLCSRMYRCYLWPCEPVGQLPSDSIRNRGKHMSRREEIAELEAHLEEILEAIRQFGPIDSSSQRKRAQKLIEHAEFMNLQYQLLLAAEEADAEERERIAEEERREAQRQQAVKAERAAAARRAEQEQIAAENRLAAERRARRLEEEAASKREAQRAEQERLEKRLADEQAARQRAEAAAVAKRAAELESLRRKKEAEKEAERQRLRDQEEADRQRRIAAREAERHRIRMARQEEREAEKMAAAAQRAEAMREKARLEREVAEIAQRRQELEREKARLAEEEARLHQARIPETASPMPKAPPAEIPPEPDDTSPYPTTGPALLRWRRQQNFTESQAASYLGVSRASIYQNERRPDSLGDKILEAFRTRQAGAATDQPPEPAEGPPFQILLGASEASPQYGILGETNGKTVAIDLNQPHVISLFGVQGGGKSYTLGSLVELATLPLSQLNRLPQPYATVIFHYSASMDYAPEFTSMAHENTEEDQLKILKERYGAEPKALADIVMLVPADKLEERRLEYPNIQVKPLKFSSSELQINHWRFLMGTVGNNALYVQQIGRLLKQLRNELSLDKLRSALQSTPLSDPVRDMARQRLELAADFIADGEDLGSLLRPGRLLIVDLRDEFIEKDQAMGLFLVMLQLFGDQSFQGRPLQKLVVLDEAHKYIKNPDLVTGLIELVREMRHKELSLLVASQDPPSVPQALIELSTEILLHRFNSPSWLRHIQKANAALAGLTPEQLAQLSTGEAWVWSGKSTDPAFSKGAQKVLCRPRASRHGGATRTAVR